MEDHINIYLYIVIEALKDSKLSVEYAFNEINEPNEKLMGYDTFEHLMLTQRSYKIFYTTITQQYEIKITRQNGFPFFFGKVCKK
jgi:hypothetical protein